MNERPEDLLVKTFKQLAIGFVVAGFLRFFFFPESNPHSFFAEGAGLVISVLLVKLRKRQLRQQLAAGEKDMYALAFEKTAVNQSSGKFQPIELPKLVIPTGKFILRSLLMFGLFNGMIFGLIRIVALFDKSESLIYFSYVLYGLINFALLYSLILAWKARKKE